MKPLDATRFNRLVADVSAFYRHEYSEHAGRVWWQSMQPFDFEAVAEAFNRHAVNPDAGQFMPKPADIIRMLQGSTQDAGLVAWAKVDRGVRTVGTYRSVVFDDPLVHRIITEMGGWMQLGGKNEDEWPFVRNEFVNRYRGCRMRNEVPEYPSHLIGMAEAQNAKSGFAVEPPVLLGDPVRAALVMEGGTKAPLLAVTHVSRLAATGTLQLEGARGNA